MTQSVAALIEGRARDIGIPVRRILPAAGHRMVGPFIFLDHMGPVALPPGQGMDVRPHPHIGLATVTYLFEGEIMHRDSVGAVQAIRPGDVNWMIAGRGIVHSERTAPARRAAGLAMDGIQSWVALPLGQEEAPPSFRHHPAASLPVQHEGGARFRLIAGTFGALRAPVAVASPTIYGDLVLDEGAEFAFPAEHEERAVYVAQGAVEIDGERVESGHLAVLVPGAAVVLRAAGPARAMLLGGANIGERFIWWNFVSSDLGRIERAKADWAAQRFAPVPGETEFTPLPTDPPPRGRVMAARGA